MERKLINEIEKRKLQRELRQAVLKEDVIILEDRSKELSILTDSEDSSK